MLTDTKPKPETEILLAALARRPENLKLLADDRARLVAERQARVERIRALDAQAEIAWPREQKARDAAAAKVQAAERALRAARDDLGAVNSAILGAQQERTAARRAEEVALLDGADVATVEKFKSACLDELHRLMRPGVLVSAERVEKNPVTREMRRTGESNVASVKARLAAVGASFSAADELKLLPDQSGLDAIIEAQKAAWPSVDAPAFSGVLAK